MKHNRFLLALLDQELYIPDTQLRVDEFQVVSNSRSRELNVLGREDLGR
jgi:hypothetical protein